MEPIGAVGQRVVKVGNRAGPIKKFTISRSDSIDEAYQSGNEVV
jgi:hypothetical protein